MHGPVKETDMQTQGLNWEKEGNTGALKTKINVSCNLFMLWMYPKSKLKILAKHASILPHVQGSLEICFLPSLPPNNYQHLWYPKCTADLKQLIE